MTAEAANESRFLQEAAVLACRGLGHTRPNPPVGAVIVRQGEIIAGGWHARAGREHAEAMAIRLAGAENCRGAELYVTLEPCSTAGRVGACTDAILRAGFSRVVYGVDDPNPKNAGRAQALLRERGIACDCFARTHPADETLLLLRALIAPFAKHVTTGRPFVTVKMALSMDGKAHDEAGDARWISSEADRRRTGLLRRAADAVLVGARTVRADNPSLLWHGGTNDDLIRAVVSKSGNLPEGAQIFTDGAPNETLVFDDPVRALEELGRRGALHVLCEGGLTLAASLAERGLVDDWLTVVSPCVIGARPMAAKVPFGGDSTFVNPGGTATALLDLIEQSERKEK